VSDLFDISVSALNAFQAAINVTSNNVANANTPGYDRESVNLNEALPQSNGTLTVGSGVVVSGVSRAYSQAATNQLNSSQSTLGQLTALQNYSTQIDNLFGTSAGGLSTALQNFYSAWSSVADDPTSTAARQSLLGQAQSVASAFQTTSSQLNGLNTDVNTRITADVTQINSIAASIATLNKQIVVGTAQNSGQPPPDLLDQRDQLVSNLSQLVGVQTTTNSDGSVNVLIGNGQPLVVGALTTQLTTTPNQFNASQLEISTSALNGSPISNDITTGDLGGLLAARSQVINPALNQLGQVATALSQTVNSQQAKGLDLSGNFGAAIFSTPSTQAEASAHNTDGVTASVTVSPTGTGALTSNDYLVSYNGTAYSLSNASTGTAVPFTIAGNTLTADGLSIALSGTPAAGDQFLIQPTVGAAGSLKVVLTDPSKIAAAGAVTTAAASGNAGTGTISGATVLNAANPALLTPATLHHLHQPADGLFDQRRRQHRLHVRRQHRIRRLASADQRHARQRRHVHGVEQRRRYRRQQQRAGERRRANDRGVVERHDLNHQRRQRADHRVGQPGAADQHGADGAGGRQYPGPGQRAIGVRRESR
jgi:flagellar hook-associated protein 1 FlgK